MDILLMILMVKKLLDYFIKKNCKKQIKKNLSQKKELREKEICYTLNGKAMIYFFNSWIDEKDIR